MKIADVHVAPYRLPLSRRYRVGSVDLQERAGRLVRLTSEDGLRAYGEISPLPGLHEESLADVDKALHVMGPDLCGRTFGGFPSFAGNVADRAAACAPQGELGAPSLVFGLQSAGAALWAQAADTTPAAILCAEPRDRIAVNALFIGDTVAAAEAIASGALDAYTCVKVKVGRASAAQERQMLKILLAGLPDATQLRLDANRSLSLDDAVARFHGLPPARIEYLEEPLANPDDLADLHARTGLPIGLDETLHVPALFHLGRAPWVSAWCLKPARVGHWQRMQFLARQAAKHGAAAVVSSCLETGLGLGMQAQMAAALPGNTAAAGLGTESWLRLDLVAPPYDSRRGFVRTCDWHGTPSARVLAKLVFRRAGR